jgi:hypothetical protein
MLFTMMIFLAISATIVEGMFASKFKYWRINAHKFKWLNMVISIGISFVLGVMFGAAGLIAMGAAMISTVMSIPMYAFLHWNYDSPMAAAHGGNMYLHNKGIFKVQYLKWKQVMIDFTRVIYLTLRAITAPIWICRSAAIKIKELIDKFVSRNVSKSTGTVP